MPLSNLNLMSRGLSPEQQLRLTKMVDEIEDYAIILLDKNGNVENWNKGAQKIKGYTADEILGKHFSIFYTQEDKAKNMPQQLIEEAIINGKGKREGWRIRKDGTRFWGSILLTTIHDDEGGVIGFTKVTRDLTAVKQNEEKLRQAEERYQQMILEVSDYAIILLDKYGNIERWNKGAEKVKGYSTEEIIGKNFRVFYLKEDQERHLPEKLMNEAIVNGRVQHEGWRVRKDGTKFWGLVTITALHNDNGEIIGFSKVTKDLTDKLLAEEEQKKYVLQLERKNKELEQYAYIASHDLQEPLRTISSFTDLLRTTLKNNLDEQTEKYINVIINAAGRMRNLINGLLDYSLIGNGLLSENVDCNELLENVKLNLGALIAETSTLLVYDKLPIIIGYPNELSQLFQNLVHNAIKYRKQQVQPVILINAVEKKDKWLFSIRDNGIGIEPVYLGKIFNIFQRLHTRDKYPGNGIGLANCKKIVELHSGEIWAESIYNEGSTFYFTISKHIGK